MKAKLLKITAVMIFLLFSNLQVQAHCDGLDGPVVRAAQKSLETGNINFTLIWINEGSAEEVKNVFQKTLSVRSLSPEAKEIADMYFFETVVRLHRMGEGEPFTGLKPAGRDLGPAVPAADLAIEKNSLAELQTILQNSFQERLEKLFEHVTHTKNFNENDVEAGREFIESYVNFIHFAEKSYELSSERHIHSHEQQHQF
jgi:hypothetical protein